MTILHIGDHTALTLSQLGLHLIEADHVFFMALTLVVGWSAYRAGRRAEARAQASKRTHEDARR